MPTQPHCMGSFTCLRQQCTPRSTTNTSWQFQLALTRGDATAHPIGSELLAQVVHPGAKHLCVLATVQHHKRRDHPVTCAGWQTSGCSMCFSGCWQDCFTEYQSKTNKHNSFKPTVHTRLSHPPTNKIKRYQHTCQINTKGSCKLALWHAGCCTNTVTVHQTATTAQVCKDTTRHVHTTW